MANACCPLYPAACWTESLQGCQHLLQPPWLVLVAQACRSAALNLMSFDAQHLHSFPAVL